MTRSITERIVITVDQIEDRAKQGRDIVLPLEGKLEFGRSAELTTVPNAPQMRSAKIAIIGHGVARNSLYKADNVELSTGDVLTFEQPLSPFFGTLIVDENPGIDVTAKVVATRGVVSRPPAAGYALEPSMVDRIKGDSFLQIVWAAFVFLWGTKKYFSAQKGSKDAE